MRSTFARYPRCASRTTPISATTPSAANTQDAPDRIVPCAGADTPVHDGVLEMALPPLSWNMLRICGDDYENGMAFRWLRCISAALSEAA